MNNFEVEIYGTLDDLGEIRRFSGSGFIRVQAENWKDARDTVGRRAMTGVYDSNGFEFVRVGDVYHRNENWEPI